MFAAIGILMALEARHRTGRGQRVATSLLEGQIAMLSYHLTSYFASGRVPQRNGAAGQLNVPYQAFKTADEWLVIAAFNERMWRGVCEAIERPEWAEDPRFRDAASRIGNREMLIESLNAVLGSKPADYWRARLTKAGVPCTPVNGIDQIVHDEQVAACDMIVELDVPTLGRIRMAGLPIKLEETPGQISAPPPLLGEHSTAVLRRLGYDERDISRLAARGVVGVPG
jgi:crotonobetainyl-CoA:carnitine CoA-transferase CaiB-like acyl-CoA transferase